MITGCGYSEDGQEQAGMGVGVADFNGDNALDIVTIVAMITTGIA